MAPGRYELSYEQWEQIKELFLAYTTGRPSKRSNREMFNAMLFSIEGSHVLGDKAYGAEAIRDKLTSKGAHYTISPRTNTKEPRSVDWYLYKKRHVVECFFNKLKHFGRVATRYDKLATSFLAFVYIAAIFKLTQ